MSEDGTELRAISITNSALGRALRAAVALLTVVGCGLIATASAQADYTWTGSFGCGGQYGCSYDTGWSEGNWSGTPQFATDPDLGELTFPALPTCSIGASACYISLDDLGATLNASEITMDDRVGYSVSADQAPALGLGAGGFHASPTADPHEAYTGLSWAIPLVLESAQNWSVTGDGVAPFDTAISFYDAAVTEGGGDPNADTLGLTLGDEAEITFFSPVDTAGLTISGANANVTGALSAQNGQVLANDLDGDDDAPVTINNVAYEVEADESGGFATTQTVGPLTVNDGSLVIGGLDAPAGILHVNGALNIGAGSWTEFGFAQAGSTPNTDFGQLQASGNITLGGQLAISAAACGAGVGVGDTATFITTTGTLSGTFSNAPNGAVIPVDNCAAGSALGVRIEYTANSMTATTVSGATTAVALAASPTAPAAGQSTTLTASVSTSSTAFQAPTGANGSVEFLSNGNPITGCTSQPVTATSETQGTATCTTSFAASSAPLSLTAVYTPTTASALSSSTSPALSLSVGGTSGGGSSSPGAFSSAGGGSTGRVDTSPQTGISSAISSRVTVGDTKVKGATTMVALTCAGSTSCALGLALSVSETITADQITGTTARSQETKRKKRTVSVGSMRIELAAGAKREVELSLNHAGELLLRRFHKLSVKFVITESGTEITTRTLHFSSRA